MSVGVAAVPVPLESSKKKVLSCACREQIVQEKGGDKKMQGTLRSEIAEVNTSQGGV